MAGQGKRLSMFGLAHCSTCQKAQAELEAAGWTVDFRDVAQEPLSEAERQRLAAEFGARIVNRASLTWRGMSEAERAADPVAYAPAVVELLSAAGMQWRGQIREVAA